MSFFKDSFRNRLALSFLLASLVPMLLCCVLLFQIIQLRMDNQNIQQAQFQAQNVSTRLDVLSQGLTDAVETLEASSLLKSREPHQIYRILYNATAPLRSWGSFDLYDSSGSCLYSTGTDAEETLPTNWGILLSCRRGAGKPSYLAPGVPDDSDSPSLLCGAALTDEDGSVLGYLVMRMYRDNWASLLSETGGLRSDLLLLNSYWRPIYGSQENLTGTLADRLRHQLLSGQIPGSDSDDFQYYITSHGDTGFYLVLRQPRLFNKNTVRQFLLAALFCGFICILISVALCLQLSRQLFRPIRQLQSAFVQLGQNHLDVRVAAPSQDEFSQLAGEFNQMVAALKQNREALVENQRELNQAQIRMLQAQLNPHFLCNTLDTMKWMGKINHLPELAMMATDLADILRFSITDEEFVPLYREVQILDRYIEIQKVRLSDQFTFSTRVPEELEGCLVPKMILQPIVENSVLHGLEGAENGAISVQAVRLGENILQITVTDNGRGFPENLLGRPLRREDGRQGHHLGLYNVDTILRKRFGEDSGLTLSNDPETDGAIVTAQLPITMEEFQ